MNVRKPDPDKMRAMRIILKAAFDCIADEPVPKSIHDTLKGLR